MNLNERVVDKAIDELVVILSLLHKQLGDIVFEQEFLDRVQAKLNKQESENV